MGGAALLPYFMAIFSFGPSNDLFPLPQGGGAEDSGTLDLLPRDDFRAAPKGARPEVPSAATQARLTFYTGHEDRFGTTTAVKGPDGANRAREGVTVAVDPAVIPYGSRVRIPALAQLSEKKDGIFFAHDTGTDVKSRRASRGKEPVIDVFVAGDATKSRQRMNELQDSVGLGPLDYEVVAAGAEEKAAESELPKLDGKDQLENYAAGLGFEGGLSPAGSNGPGDLGLEGAKAQFATRGEASGQRGRQLAASGEWEKPAGVQDWGKFAVLFGSAQREQAAQNQAKTEALATGTQINFTQINPARGDSKARLDAALGMLPRTF